MATLPRLAVERQGVVLALVALLGAVALSAPTQPTHANPTTGLVAIDAGWSRTCALTAAAGVECWGATFGTTAVEAPELASGIQAITVGGAHACVLTAAGGVKCWGANAEGQLGDGTFGERLTPVDVVGVAGDAVAVTAGGYFTCALIVSGDVQCWGDNSQGQLGDGTSGNYQASPVNVSGMDGAGVAVAAGGDHACANTTAGTVKCWGNDRSGQLGDGAGGGIHATPVSVTGLSGEVAAIALGHAHSCAVTVAGAALCWGSNSSGQLGIGTFGGNELVAIDVVGLSSGVVAIAAGVNQTCAIADAENLTCWGDNTYGQLGDGTTTSRPSPTGVTGLAQGAVAVAAGTGYTCSLQMLGGPRCWGLNDSGQLGDGTITQRLTPVAVVSEAKPTPTPSATPPSPEGDADCSGGVNSIDAAVILQFVARLIDQVGCWASADTNDDGRVDSKDAVLILQFAAGFLTAL